jgi:hypothetical protein
MNKFGKQSLLRLWVKKNPIILSSWLRCLIEGFEQPKIASSFSATGLPDGLFSNQKSKFWYNLEGLGIETVVIFYGLLEYFTAILYNLQPFGTVCGHLVYFIPFWYVWTKKNLSTLLCYMECSKIVEFCTWLTLIDRTQLIAINRSLWDVNCTK